MSAMTRDFKRGLVALSLLLGSAVLAAAGCATSVVNNSGTCTGTETQCLAGCVDLAKDHENCGTCGKACTASEVCAASACATAQGCDGGIVCGSSCTDIKTDPKNCGTCGKACGAGEACSAGSCSTTCSGGQTKCGGDGGAPYCATTASDPMNCGACGKTCAALQTCVGGACTPDCSGIDGGVQTICAGDGGPAYCAALQTDKANCGVCGKACKVNETCVAAACTAACSPTWLASNQSWTQNNLTYASEILNSTYNPTNLLDNNVTTRWVTSSTTNQWVIFNFGAPVTLSGIQILNQANYTANAGGKDTALEKGPGLSGPWTNVTSFQVANQQSSAQTFNFAASTSQYWRVFVTNNWGYPSYIQFMEVGFYGCP